MNGLEQWHRYVESGDLQMLDDLLADNCVFYSPIVHTPQEGKAVTRLYLAAASEVLGGESFRYLREISDDRQAVLEFEAEHDGIFINGVDMFTWDEQGKIDSFKVMVRPLKAINLLHGRMKAMLEKMTAGAQETAS
jgi:hypothetical protein